MTRFPLFLGAAFALAVTGIVSCTQQQNDKVVAAMQTKPGQLFCAIQKFGGGTVVVALIDAAATSSLGAAAPLAVMATDRTKQQVDADCDQAAKNVGGVTGIPVSPPATPSSATVAVKPAG